MSANPYQAQIEQLESQIADAQADAASDPELAALAAEEITRLQTELQMLQDAATALSAHQEDDAAPDTETGKKGNCTIEIRGGAGGDRFVEQRGASAHLERVVPCEGQEAAGVAVADRPHERGS